MGFDIKGLVEQGVDKAQDLINDKAGKEVVNDDIAQKAGEVISEQAQSLTEKFTGK